MSNGEVTTNEIMEFLEENVVTKDDLKEGFKRFPTKEDLRQELKRMATKEDLRQEVGKLKSDLLDAMDQKNVNLKADLVILMRKEDTKLVGLISLLKDKRVISDEEAKSLLGLEPFPQLSVA